jgi:uncharacterized protein involved in outer membrane biogenesis
LKIRQPVSAHEIRDMTIRPDLPFAAAPTPRAGAGATELSEARKAFAALLAGARPAVTPVAPAPAPAEPPAAAPTVASSATRAADRLERPGRIIDIRA